MITALAIWKRIGLVFVSTMVVWLLIAMFFDYGPIDDSDLALPEDQVIPLKNPFPEIRDLDWSEEERDDFDRVTQMLNGHQPFDIEFLDGMLKRHSGVLDQFARYAAMDQWRDDRTDAVSPLGSYTYDWLRVASLKQVESASLLAKGNSKGAFECAVTLLDFSSGMYSSRIPVIETYHAAVMSDRGFNCLAEMLSRHRFEIQELEWLANRLESPNLMRNDLESILRANYLVANEILAQGVGKRSEFDSPEWLPAILSFKRNRTKAMLADFHRALIEANRDDPAGVNAAIEAASYWGPRSEWAHHLSGNGLGCEFVQSYTGAVIGVIVNRYRASRANLALLRTSVALERFRFVHGDWPDGLGELVPDYLDEVPLDPLDGAPIRFDPKRTILYSIGRNLIDDGGIEVPESDGSSSKDGDIVLGLWPRGALVWPQFPPGSDSSE